MGHHRRKRRGRPFKSPHITQPWDGYGERNTLELFDYELEVLKLIDLHGFTQEEAALKMKPPNDTISRGNINRYLQSARKKVVQALLTSEHINLRVINTQNNEM